MKAKITISEEACELCNKAPSVEFFRRGRKNENVNQCLYICEACLTKGIARAKRRLECKVSD